MASTALFKLSIKKDDRVQVISGREKGKIGRVLRVDPATAKILVEKTNMLKRHQRPTQKAPQGGIVEKEAPIPYSNVLLFCPKCNRGVRHGKRLEEKKAGKGAKQGASGNKRTRYCKKCDGSLDGAA